MFLTGLAFAGLGLIMTSLSPSYDFFMDHFTLVITPMMLACGVFFPLEQLPLWLQNVAQALPLTHAVALARPLMNGARSGGDRVARRVARGVCRGGDLCSARARPRRLLK